MRGLELIRGQVRGELSEGIFYLLKVNIRLMAVLLLYIQHRARDRALQEGRGIMATPIITLTRKYHTNIEIESNSPQLK